MLVAVLPLEGDLSGWRIALFGGAIVTIVTIVTLAAILLSVPAARQALRRAARWVFERPGRTLFGILVLGIAVQSYREWKARRSLEPRHADVPARVAGTDWPMDRGAPSRAGRVGESAGPRAAKIELHWRYGRPGESYYSSPAVIGNRVYAVGSEAGSGRVVAVDVDSGKLAWSGGPPGYRATFSSPVIVGDQLVCGEGLHTTRRSRVFALDLRPGREGTLAWSFSTDGHVECTPQVAAGHVFFNAGDDGVYALESPRADSGGADVRFHASGPRYADAETALLVHDGRCYVGLGIGGESLCMFDAATGRELARVATGLPVFAPPALDGDALYIGLGSGDYANPEAAQAGAVWRLNRETLAVEWRRDLPGTVLGAIVVDRGDVLWSCGDGRVYAVSSDNQSLRSWDSGAPIAASLAVTPQFIYGVNRGGTLFAIERSTNDFAWRESIGRSGHYVSGPVVVGERLILGTPHDGLVCYGPRRNR